MAHGLSLELAKITRTPAEVQCECGQPWASHFKKNLMGKLIMIPEYRGHVKAGTSPHGMNRANRRRMGMYANAQKRAARR